MSGHVEDFRAQAQYQASVLLDAIATAESIIVSTIERECEALRTGRMLAAEALHLRLRDAACLYLHAAKAARASLHAMRPFFPEIGHALEDRRAVFANVLQVELAVLAAERAAAAAGRQQAIAAREHARAAGGMRSHQGPALRVVTGRAETRGASGKPSAPRWNAR